ncbi:hypothetical protein EMQ25_03475 [Arsenicitalea aurantiaca]|uniref:Dynamin n=1 Tax=Arsenicitalea aurantiaca TaxID=1783274 RepID=A0A433XMA7_9HYPH|nr:hypothetical protein EMQ25_03475 [Arsenicitalea aurantiaca]
MIVALALLAIAYLVFSANTGGDTAAVNTTTTPAVEAPADPAIAPAPMTEAPAAPLETPAPALDAPAAPAAPVDAAPAAPAEETAPAL